jgi:hypothetical protein
MNTTNSKYNMASLWLPTTVALTIMDPNQPGPLMKLPISIDQLSLQCHTSVLIDLETTLNFMIEEIFTRNNIL